MSRPSKPTAAVAPPPDLPPRVRMLRPFGFHDDTGRHRFWRQGLVVDDATDIAILRERGAAFEPVE